MLIILMGTTIAAASGDKGLVRLYRMRAEYNHVVARIAEIDADNSRLRKEVRLLREDRRSIERIAREELGLARPGERIYQFGP